MLVARLVVEDGLALQRVLGVAERDARLLRAPAVAIASSSAFSAVRASPPERTARNVDHVVAGTSSPAGAALERAPQQRLDVAGLERVQLVDLGAREQRGVDLEAGVLGRRADQRQQPLLDRRQQRVRWALSKRWISSRKKIVARRAAAAVLAGAGDHLAHLGAAGVDRRELLERGGGVLGREPRERRLAGAGRPAEDHRVRLARLERGAQRRALAEQVLLADELRERTRPHARGERSIGGLFAALLLGWIEQSLHYGHVAPLCRIGVARPDNRVVGEVSHTAGSAKSSETIRPGRHGERSGGERAA